MGHQVTIEGSLTPAVDLPRGERRTVEVTTYIRKLVQIGAVIVVDGSLDPPAAETVAVEPDSDPEVDDTDEDEAEEADEAEPSDDTAAPHGNASKAEWLAFLNSKKVAIPTDDEGRTPTRDGLKTIWQQANGGS